VHTKPTPHNVPVHADLLLLTVFKPPEATLAIGRVQLFSAPHPAANRRPGQLVVTSRPIPTASAAGALSWGSSAGSSSHVPLIGSEPITMYSDPGELIDSLDAATVAAAAANAGASNREVSDGRANKGGYVNGGHYNGGASNGGASNGGAFSSPGSRPAGGGLAAAVEEEGEGEGEGLVGLNEAVRSLRAAQRADLAALGRRLLSMHAKSSSTW